MAKKKDKGQSPKIEGSTYFNNPEKFCISAYEESNKRIEEVHERNLDNRLFYEGEDTKLKERANNEDIQRSSLFVPLLKPAIDTRKADVLAAVDEREQPIIVKFNPDDKDGPIPDEQKAQLSKIASDLNETLRNSGYLDGGFDEHITGAEIYYSPSAVKCDWEEVYEKEPQVKELTEAEMLQASILGEDVSPKVIWVNKYKGGRFTTEWIPPDQFLYESGISDFQKSEYTGHAIWEPWFRIEQIALELGFDRKKVDIFKQETSESDADSTTGKDTIIDDLQDEIGVPLDSGYKDGKVLLVEMYVCTYSETGEEIVYRNYILGNKYLVKKEVSPHRGVRFPFSVISGSTLPGSLEGQSSIDIGKPLQRLYNEIFNIYLDGTSYNLFPPLLQDAGTFFKERPKWGLGKIWKLVNAEGLTPLIKNPGQIPDLPNLMSAVEAKLHNLLNAYDLAQGFQSQQYEKAAATKLRAAGSAQKAKPLRKRYGKALLEISRIALAFMQQYHPEGYQYVLPVVLDAPALTSVTDPENDKQEALLLTSNAAQSEIYANPIGQRKLRNLMQKQLELFIRGDVLEYIISAEEFEATQKVKTEMVNNQIDGESIQETMGVAAASGAQGGQ